MRFSLPTQRCFRPVWAIRIRQLLFSAYAEVFLSPKAPKPWKATFLCLRRGVSPGYRKSDRIAPLFSAYAEVFPVVSDALAALAAFLCLRRGVSLLCKVDDAMLDFSLPTQRCFLKPSGVHLRTMLFSAYAEVFPELRRLP